MQEELLLTEFPKQITTPRLILRPPQQGDGEKFHKALLDGYDDLIKWLNRNPQKPSIEDLEKESRILSAKWILREDIRYMCIRRDSDEIIGRLAFPHPLCVWDVPLAGISYFISKIHQNQGFCSEAVNALTRVAFDQLKAKKVEIKCDLDNISSWRVPEKLGFKLEAKQKGNWPRPDKAALAEIATYVCFNKEGLPALDIQVSL